MKQGFFRRFLFKSFSQSDVFMFDVAVQQQVRSQEQRTKDNRHQIHVNPKYKGQNSDQSHPQQREDRSHQHPHVLLHDLHLIGPLQLRFPHIAQNQETVQDRIEYGNWQAQEDVDQRYLEQDH